MLAKNILVDKPAAAATSLFPDAIVASGNICPLVWDAG